MGVGILVLAAGLAIRFGSDKRRALLPGGRRVIDATLANIRNSGLPVLVCLGEDDDELARQLNELEFSCLRCSRAGEGMGGTLAEGAGHIPGWNGVLVALVDMPWIAPASYQAVAERLTAHNIVVPVYRGQRGHPVGFGHDFYPQLARLGGDAGARSLLARQRAHVMELALADPAIHRDIDVPADISLA